MENNNNASNGSIIQHEVKALLRLNKFISDSGYCSRREADRLIEAGNVLVDGAIAIMGLKVSASSMVKVNEVVIKPKESAVYMAFHKPVGIICTTDQAIENNIIDYLKYQKRIFPIGRLDKDSSGLILLTNDGDVVNKVLRCVNNHEKEYIVKVNKPISDEFLAKMQAGVKIYNPVNNTYQVTNKCKVGQTGLKEFKIILTQGLNRQIRRMCTTLDFKVEKLKRIRVMNIELNDLSVGKWRYLSDKELFDLNESLIISKKEA